MFSSAEPPLTYSLSSWQLVHASVSNLQMTLFFLFIIIGTVILLGPEGKYAPEYYSARGEDCPPRLDDSLKDYVNKDAGEEYHYVYRKVAGEYTWVCIDMHSFEDKDPETVSIPSGALAC